MKSRRGVIWTNTIVFNEENFIWFAIMSVIDYVDQILVWDTGSTDKTIQIIKEIQKIKGDKISLRQVGQVDKFQFTKLRQEMLNKSKCDWILILDGDEIWWEESIKKVVEVINQKGDKIEGIAVPFIVPVGDIYHFQEELAGEYHLLDRVGNLSLRLFRKGIPGLHVEGPYGKESYFDLNNRVIQEGENIIFVDAPYLHLTHLKRSSASRKYDKYKYELGESAGKDFKYPEVFYMVYPNIVSSPWHKISGIELIKARLITPLRKIKRRLT